MKNETFLLLMAVVFNLMFFYADELMMLVGVEIRAGRTGLRREVDD